MARGPSIEELRRVCQPPEIVGRRTEEHWTGRLFMRRISLHVTRAALRLGLSANAVTGIMLVLGLVAPALLLVAGVWPAVGVVIALQVFVLLDASDGEVARWNRTQGATGIYLDRIAHYTNEAALFAALGWRAGDLGTWWPVVGLAAAIGVMLARAETDLIDAARVKAGLDAIRDTGGGSRSGAVSSIRRIADFIPIHRAVGAVEMTLLTLGAAVVDSARGDLVATQALLGGLAVVAWLVVAWHLLTILTSDRLR